MKFNFVYKKVAVAFINMTFPCSRAHFVPLSYPDLIVWLVQLTRELILGSALQSLSGDLPGYELEDKTWEILNIVTLAAFNHPDNLLTE